MALAWAPLPFGGVTPWAEASLRVLAFCALALAALALPGATRLRSAAPPAAALVAFALFGLAQSIPLPQWLVATIAPEHATLYRAEAELAKEGAGSARLSVAPAASRSAALGWLAIAAALAAAAVAGHGSRERRLCAGAVLAAGLFEVFYGAHHWFSRSTTLWGVELHFSATRLHGTFVNPNHAALYLEMALAIVFAWGWWSLRRASSVGPWERRIFLFAPPLILWFLLFAGLAFTGSRAGLLAAIAAVSIQGLLAVRRRRRWLAPLGALFALLGLVVVAALGRQEGLGRLLATSSDDASLDSRFREYGAVIDLWGKFPLTGSGLGTFRDAFPMVQASSLPNSYWHPHSSLLEIPATTGLVGVLLLAVGLWLLVRRLAFVLRWGLRSEDRAAGLAALGALVSVALHEALDFGLTMPGNAFTLAVLIGLTLPARTEVRLSRESVKPGSEKPRRSRKDLPAVGAGELQHVQAGPDGDRDAEGKVPARGRDREGA
jgi:O-antigen ligase